MQRAIIGEILPIRNLIRVKLADIGDKYEGIAFTKMDKQCCGTRKAWHSGRHFTGMSIISAGTLLVGVRGSSHENDIDMPCEHISY